MREREGTSMLGEKELQCWEFRAASLWNGKDSAVGEGEKIMCKQPCSAEGNIG